MLNTFSVPKLPKLCINLLRTCLMFHIFLMHNNIASECEENSEIIDVWFVIHRDRVHTILTHAHL